MQRDFEEVKEKELLSNKSHDITLEKEVKNLKFQLSLTEFNFYLYFYSLIILYFSFSYKPVNFQN